MEKAESLDKGKIILATVKGDVHDIGKNLVDIILTNNGYRVVNLGIKIPPEELIKAYASISRRDRLSGLLVKSAQMMVTTAQDLKTAGIAAPSWSAARRSRRASRGSNRARISRARRICQRRDGRPRPRQPAHGSAAARGA